MALSEHYARSMQSTTKKCPVFARTIASTAWFAQFDDKHGTDVLKCGYDSLEVIE
jgi:hypothetical protein